MQVTKEHIAHLEDGLLVSPLHREDQAIWFYSMQIFFFFIGVFWIFGSGSPEKLLKLSYKTNIGFPVPGNRYRHFRNSSYPRMNENQHLP